MTEEEVRIIEVSEDEITVEIVEEVIMVEVGEEVIVVEVGEAAVPPVWGMIGGDLSDQLDLAEALDRKADLIHTHDDRYYTEAETDSLLTGKADAVHTHDDRYYTEAETDSLLTGKADAVHTHDDRYYTEAETDSLLTGKADAVHTHDDRYYTETETDSFLDDKAGIIIAEASGAPAVFPDGAAGPAAGLTVSIEPVQTGSGDPSPENIRPISGWTGVNLSVNGTTVSKSWQTAAGTVYKGSLDVLTGILTVTHLITVPVITRRQSENTYGISNWQSALSPKGTTQYNKLSSYCNTFIQDDTSISNATIEGFMVSGNNLYIRLLSTRASTVAEANQFISGLGTYVVYELGTPVTYQLDPTEIRTILGNNTVSADTGPVAVRYRADTKGYIDKKFAELQALILEN